VRTRRRSKTGEPGSSPGETPSGATKRQQGAETLLGALGSRRRLGDGAFGLLARAGEPGVEGENQAECAALADLRLHPDLSAVPFHDQSADVEPEPRAR